MVARRSGTNTRQGKRQGQAAKQPDPPSWECNAGITKIKAQEGKSEPKARPRVLDTVDGRAQPGQYGCHHCRLRRGCCSLFWLPSIFETCRIRLGIVRHGNKCPTEGRHRFRTGRSPTVSRPIAFMVVEEPTPRHRNRQRVASFHLRTRALDDSGPFLSVGRDEGLEFGRRDAEHVRAEIGHARLDARIV